MAVGTIAQHFAGRYRLEERLANGGQGEVWRAHDLVLDRPVAVKLIGADLNADPVALQRFEREAKAAAALAHPNVAQVLDYAHDDGLAGIVMELIDGETLSTRIRREGSLPVSGVVAVGSGILAALAVAHDAGLVHRDVKPSNVVIRTDGFVKVTDFGIAAAVGDGDTTLTEPDMVMGSAPYLAPEQVRGDRPSPAVDIYSTGLVLYEALTGQLPFEADTPPAVALARLQRAPAPVRSHRPDVPETVAAVVMRALQQEPRARFRTADAMRGALEAAGAAASTDDETTRTWTMPAVAVGLASSADEARPGTLSSTAPVPVRGAASVRRWRALALLAVLVFLAGLFAGRAVANRTAQALASVEVPAMVGMTVEEAKQALDGFDLELRTAEVEAEEPTGTVLAQDVAPGVFVAPGTPVHVQVSSGTAPCCTVPEMTGLALGDAQQALADAGLVLGGVTEDDVDAEAGTVLAQEPLAGTEVDEGSAVHLLVAGDDDAGPFPGRGSNRGRGGDDD